MADRRALIALLVAGLSPGSALALDIGSVAAANTSVWGIAPQAPDSRNLSIGDKVVRNERVTSSDIGSGQLIFLDSTTLTISPGADLVLDNYVYDPETGAGEMALTMTRGVMRFIGGRITKSAEATITTPNAVIGVRGGIAAITVENGMTRACLVAGERMRIVGRNGEELVMSRNNAFAIIGPNGTPEFGGIAGPAEMRVIYNAFGQTRGGGLPIPPTEEQARAASQDASLYPVNAGAPGAPRSRPVSTLGERPPEEPEQRPIETVQDDGSSGSVQQPGTETPGGGEYVPPEYAAPLVAFQGSDAPYVEWFTGQTVTDPQAAGLAAAPANRVYATEAALVPLQGDELDPAGYYITFTDDQGGLWDLRPENGIAVTRQGDHFGFGPLFFPGSNSGATPYGAVSAVGFNDGEAFNLTVWTASDDSGALGFAALGDTSGALPMQPVGAGDVEAFAFILGDDLLRNASISLGLNLPEHVDADLYDLTTYGLHYLIAGPDQPFLNYDGTASGYDAGSTARIVSASLTIDGAGANQSTLLFTSLGSVLPTVSGDPLVTLSQAYLASTGAGAEIARGFGLTSTVPDQNGDTLYGGKHLALAPLLSSYDGDVSTTTETSLFGQQLFSRELGTAQLNDDGVVDTTGYGKVQVLSYSNESFVVDAAARSGETLTGGFSTGVVQLAGGQEYQGVEAAPVAIRTLDAADVRIEFNPASNGAAAEFLDFYAPGEDAAAGISIGFGSVQCCDSAAGVYLSDRVYAMQQSDGGALPFSGGTTSLLGYNAQASTAALASYELVGDGGIFDQVGADPFSEVFQWGWWGAQLRADSGQWSGTAGDLRGFVPLGAWVAGTVTDITALGYDGFATFEGGAIATVAISGTDDLGNAVNQIYVDAGEMVLNYDFYYRQGFVDLTDIDGGDYFAAVTEAEAIGSNHFGGALYSVQSGDMVGATDGVFVDQVAGGTVVSEAAGVIGGFDATEQIGTNLTRTITGVYGGDVVPGQVP